MATPKQQLGAWGEIIVARDCSCPRCKRPKCLKRLPPNFKCADLICDFCGFLAQVKAKTVKQTDQLPKEVLGAAWGPQQERMDAAIYFPLYLVLVGAKPTDYSIFYLSADLQTRELFKPRKPLTANAKRAGWQGYLYDLEAVHDRFVRLV